MRVAIGCVLGALPVEAQTKVKAALAQHVLAIEEASQDTENFPGAEALVKVMTEEFDCLLRAAAVIPTFVEPVKQMPVKRGRKKSTGST